MYQCTVSQLEGIIGGTSVDERVGRGLVTGGTIDSRLVEHGDIFFALQGSNCHGILFADEAVARGAACVVTDIGTSESFQNPGMLMTGLRSPDSAETDRHIIRVFCASEALQKLARWNRRRSESLVIGITGSVGKTSTRQMITAALGKSCSGMQSPYNFNNDFGVALSLLKLNPDHDFAVLELAAGQPGDIRRLAETADPEFAVITRVAPAHLASFGDIDAIRRTKQELVEFVGPGGTVFLNADDPAVRSMSAAASGEVVLFGLTPEASIRAVNISACSGVCSFAVDGHRFSVQGGRQLVTAALAAVAVSRVAGIANSQIAQGLAEFKPDAGRGRIALHSPWTVIDDSYNASPASVIAAIESLGDWPDARQRILVLGDMLELGSESDKFHAEIGRAIAGSAVDHAVFFGEQADVTAHGARSAGASVNRLSSFRDLSTLKSILNCIVSHGDVVLVKGSRGSHMERVVDWLLEQGRDEGFRRFAA